VHFESVDEATYDYGISVEIAKAEGPTMGGETSVCIRGSGVAGTINPATCAALLVGTPLALAGAGAGPTFSFSHRRRRAGTRSLRGE
jgi:hypothetical protein